MNTNMYLLCANSISVDDQSEGMIATKVSDFQCWATKKSASITTHNVFLAIAKQNGYSYCLEIGAMGMDAGRL